MDIAQNHLLVRAMGCAKYLVHHTECICLPPGNRILITNLKDHEQPHSKKLSFPTRLLLPYRHMAKLRKFFFDIILKRLVTENKILKMHKLAYLLETS